MAVNTVNSLVWSITYNLKGNGGQSNRIYRACIEKEDLTVIDLALKRFPS